MRNIFLAAGLFLSASVLAQTESGRQLVKQLCSPEFHGRGYVNGGDSIAAEFIRKEFEAIGCKFFKKEPFQSFQFDVNTFPASMKLRVGQQDLVPGVDFVVDPSSGGGNVSEYEALVLTAEVMESQEAAAAFFRMNESRIKTGKVIFIADIPSYAKEAKEYAAKMLPSLADLSPVIELTDTKFTWSVSDQQYAFPYLHVQKSKIDLTAPLKFSYDIMAVKRSHTARNVIAYVPAKKKSNKYFVFSAHYDHLGRMGQQTYFPGGNDNASGTAMLLELARYFKQNPIDVNVVFIAFAGEEAGLIGSHYYTEHPLFPMEKISFLFNIDIMGSGEEGATVVNATLFPKQFEALKKMNDANQYLVKIASRGEAANSDHYFFTKAGVPAFFLYTMGPNKHYHDVYDTYEELSFAEFNDLFHLLVDFATCKPK